MDYSQYPRPVVEDIARLRRRIDACRLPARLTDRNLLIGTWNIKAFGRVYPGWDSPGNAIKRNLRGLAIIAEVVRRFDVLAIQEVKRDTRGLRRLLEWLGPDWGVILSDVCGGDQGNDERLAFVFDRRRVQPSGLAGEIVLPPGSTGPDVPVEQFARTPYLVGFRTNHERFMLLSCHIKYGKVPQDRIPELQNLAAFITKEIRSRSHEQVGEENNLIVLGDFNIDERGDNPLFQAFISGGLQVPEQLHGLRTAFGTKPKYYDQIAWFMGELNLSLASAGVIDFAGAVYPELTLQQMSYRVSDHLPLYAEFTTDRSEEHMAPTLGLDPGMPDPLSTVPDAPP